MTINTYPSDKTNYVQSLMHMIKGNLGTGILAMPAAFNHCGLVNAIIGLPVLCLIAGYCVHLLVRSSYHISEKNKLVGGLDYASLARMSFESGPSWIRPYSNFMCRLVDCVLLSAQLGTCSVYWLFMVNNIEFILITYEIYVRKEYIFLMVLPFIMLMCYIRTLGRLAIASACANIIQLLGITFVIQYLSREMPAEPQVVYFKPISEVALGIGAAIFSFEGISVALPIHGKMRHPKQMGACPLGIINITFLLILSLNFLVGLLGYLHFGSQVADIISLNLPQEPLYDMLRAMYALSVFLTFPLHFYVPNAIVWSWASSRLTPNMDLKDDSSIDPKQQANRELFLDYLCRTILVLVTFVLAISVPKLNLLMDFFGSLSGTALSIMLPALLHLTTFWEHTSGSSRSLMVISDASIIIFGLFASANGSYFSFREILRSFRLDATVALATTATTSANVTSGLLAQ